MLRRTHDNELFITVNIATILARFFDTLSFLLRCECDIYEVQEDTKSIYYDVNITFFHFDSHPIYLGGLRICLPKVY